MLGREKILTAGRRLATVFLALLILLTLGTAPSAAPGQATASMSIAQTLDADAAFQAMANYQLGQDPQTTDDIAQLVIATASRTDPGADAARSRLATRIAHTLASPATPAAKKFLCRQILPIASKEQVPVLGSLLVAPPGSPQAEVVDEARAVLEAMPDPAAETALLAALEKTTGAVKAGIVESLGNRRSRRAASILIPLLDSSDPAIVGSAASALGNICGAEPENKLQGALSTVQGAPRMQVADAYLKCADRRLGAGELVPATAMYSRLYHPSEALPIRGAALRGWVLSNPEKGIPLAIEALASPEVGLQRTALQLIRNLPGNAGTTVITDQLNQAVPSVQVILLDALAERGDTSALPAVEKASQSENAPVRLAAARAIEALGNHAQVMSPAAPELIQHPRYTWQQTYSTLALLNYRRIVWQFNYGKDTRKPYFHPVALVDGPVLTCLSPRDHPWHRALWFSWKMLNGVNYWEEDPKTGLPDGRTEVVEAKVIPHNDYSATILLTLTYHTPDGPPLLTREADHHRQRPREGRPLSDRLARHVHCWRTGCVASRRNGGRRICGDVGPHFTDHGGLAIDRQRRARDLPGGAVAQEYSWSEGSLDGFLRGRYRHGRNRGNCHPPAPFELSVSYSLAQRHG